MEIEDIRDYPTVKSLFVRTLIRCPKCNKPIGERLKNKWWFMNKNGHTASFIPLEIDETRPQGSYKVSCPDESCKGGHIFVWVNESINMSDKIKSELVPTQ